MAAHSMDSSAPATAIRMRKGARHRIAGQSNTQTAHSETAARTTPETALTPKLSQSKRLARGKNVIDGDAAVAPLTGMEVGHGGFQVLGAIVGPIDILKDQLGVGAFPQKEVRQPPLAAASNDQIGRAGRCGGKLGFEDALVEV